MQKKSFYLNDWLNVIGRKRSTHTDAWYVTLAEEVLDVLTKNKDFAQRLSHRLPNVALQITAYLHDCIAQSGGWICFTDTMQAMYGKRLPFFATDEQYVPDEINLQDIAFLLWTSCDRTTEGEPTSPYDEVLGKLSKEVYDKLDAIFEQAPISNLPSSDYWVKGMKALQVESTPLPETTPLSKLTKDAERCLAFSQGYPLIFIDTYDDLNNFLTGTLGWKAQPEGCLSDLKGAEGFVIYANAKGMLIAPDVAPCFKDVHNPVYHEKEAADWGYQLFTTPGVCPTDLLKYAMKHKLLPDAQLPFAEGKELLHNNWDFIARYYLEDYYEGD